MSNYLLLSSKDKYSGTVSNGIIMLNTAITGSYQIKTFEMLNCLYNINSYNKNVRISVYNGVTTTNTTFQLDIGIYSYSEIASILEDKLTTNFGSSNFTVTYNDNTMKYTITSGAGHTFRFLFGDITNNAYLLLGFDNENQDIVDLATTQTSLNIVDIYPYKTIYMYIPSSNSSLKLSNNKNTSFKISCESDPGSIIRTDYSNENIILTFENKKSIEYIIHDYDKNEIELNNINWSLLLKNV